MRLISMASPSGRAAAAAAMVEYLNQSPTAYHAAAETCRRLLAAGFTELSERQPWSVKPGGRYFFTRNASTVVAFAVGGAVKPGAGFVVVGAHTDSPCLKLKPVSKAGVKVRTCERCVANRLASAEAPTTRPERLTLPCLPQSGFCSVGVEPYGGGIWATWFDRDLGFAGRVLVRNSDGTLSHRLVDVRRPVMRIPSLAIHLNREVNSEGFKVNAQNHLVRRQWGTPCARQCLRRRSSDDGVGPLTGGISAHGAVMRAAVASHAASNLTSPLPPAAHHRHRRQSRAAVPQAGGARRKRGGGAPPPGAAPRHGHRPGLRPGRHCRL